MNTALIPLQSFYFLVGYGVLVILYDEAWVFRDKWSFGCFFLFRLSLSLFRKSDSMKIVRRNLSFPLFHI
jgi:hypothetical protein